MKKVLLVLMLLVGALAFSAREAGALTLQGGVQYTVERARKEAFTDVEYSIPQDIIDSNLIDPNFKQNKKAIKNGANELKDRFVMYFSDGNYGIIYKNNRYFEYEYNSSGKLELIGKRTGLIYPVKCYQFTPNNELAEVTLYVNKEHSYTFTPSGQLTSHWIGDKGYDVDGKLIRESY